ncbi:MAG TPA: HEAT repeat domain-containing protein [Gemmatimonadales bacterium]|nr:HEAT repeat domain-containing protein [Gemmatimonadales bacterium]
MKTSTVLLAASLTLTGVASAVAIVQSGPVLAGSMGHGSRHAGPDSARVEAFFGALRATDPMICEMITDQVGNFWNSEGDEGVGSLDGGARRWEPVRDSLAGGVTDPAAQRRVLRSLNDDDVCIRRLAAKMMGRSTPSATPALRDALRSPTPRIREAAALAMGHADDKEFKDDLDRATRDDNPAVAAMATWALGELELPETVGRMIELTGSREIRVRRAAVWGLGQIEEARAVPTLIPMLRDADESIRVLTAEALGEIESATAAQPLGQALRDASMRVRYAAAEALGNLDDLDVAPPELIDALGSDDLYMRRKVAEALAEIGDVKSVPALGRYVSDPDLETRRAIVHALAEIENDATVPFLLRAIKDSDPEIRKRAAEALGERKEN